MFFGESCIVHNKLNIREGWVIFNHQVNIWSTVFLITGVGDTKPKPIHEVYSNGLALPQASIKYNDSHYSSNFDTTLYISNISFSDAGTYSCSIKSDSKSFELYVIGKKWSSQTLDYPVRPLVFLGPP